MLVRQGGDLAARLRVVGDQQHVVRIAHRAGKAQRGPGTAHPARIDDQRWSVTRHRDCASCGN
jgi:hypothetical protein